MRAGGEEASPQSSVGYGAYVGLFAQRSNPTGSLFMRRARRPRSQVSQGLFGVPVVVGAFL